MNETAEQPERLAMGMPGSLGPLSRSDPLRVRAHEALETMILNGLLRPGERLTEEDLANRLGVSRNPIREGLQQLAHDGFVDLRPGRGAFVHEPTPREVDEIFYVRIALESESARLAAERITAESLVRLEELLQLGEAAAAAGDPLPLLELNGQFHDMVIAAGDNAVMADLLTGLSKRIRWYFATVVVDRAHQSWKQHGNILQTLRRHDRDAAATAMAEHVDDTRRLLAIRMQSDS